MRKAFLIIGILLGLAAPAMAGDAKVALFQPRTIFHSGIVRAHTIALTFDDGPNAHTAEVLDALKALHVKATFFIVGKMAHRHPELLARIAAEGHLLANHSADHAFLGSSYDADPDRLLDELRDVDAQIEPLMKHGDKLYFRAPFGAWKSAHADFLNADRALRRYVGPVYWDIGGDITMSSDGYVLRAADWNCWHIRWSAQTCAKGYLREARRKDGGVVLMHCIHVNSAALVRAVVPPLLEEGYRFARLNEMPEYRQYETPGAEAGIARAEPPPLDPHLVRVTEVK